MKISFLIFLCCSLNLFSQQGKSYLFVGIYENEKNGICSDYAYMSEEIDDYADFAIKRKQFYETYKNNSRTQFIDKGQAIIIYQYERKMNGWNCISNVVSFKVGKSLDDCHKQLTDDVSKNPKDFMTDPKTIFTWKSTRDDRSEYFKDFGGLKGVFLAANTQSKSVIIVKLTNTTKNQLAYVQLTTDDGKKYVEYVDPDSTISRSYDSKNLNISVVYKDSKKPKESFDIIEFIKSKVREEVTNDKGKIKSLGIPVAGVRG